MYNLAGKIRNGKLWFIKIIQEWLLGSQQSCVLPEEHQWFLQNSSQEASCFPYFACWYTGKEIVPLQKYLSEFQLSHNIHHIDGNFKIIYLKPTLGSDKVPRINTPHKITQNLIMAAHKVMVPESKNIIFQHCSSILMYSKKLPHKLCTSPGFSQKFSRDATMPAGEGKECPSIVFPSPFQHLHIIKSKYHNLWRGQFAVCG